MLESDKTHINNYSDYMHSWQQAPQVYLAVLKNWLKPQGLSNNYFQKLLEDNQGPQEGQAQHLG